MTARLFRQGRVLDPASGRDGLADVRVVDGRVAEVGWHEDDGPLEVDGATVVDCADLWVMPGFVDLHTHLREPGFEDAETISSGSAAAAAGGYTALCAMANTDPVCDTPAVAELVLSKAREIGLVDVFPVGAITKALAGVELAEFGAMHDCQAGIDFFSDDGKPVADALVMRRALQYATAFDAVICNHSEDPDLTGGAQMNEGAMSSLLGLAGWPREAEEIMVARDITLAAGVGARLHVPHVSTAGTVEIIRRAKSAGVRVTAEVTPHHLTLDDRLVESYDTALKVNPPLRTPEDVRALRDGLADGTIDAVATDHAPHPHEQKEQEWENAPCGMLGLETAFSVVVTELVDSGDLDLLHAVERFTTGPAAVRDVGEHGHGLTPGRQASITVVDPDARWTVDGVGMHSRSRNTPFQGRKLASRPVHTLLGSRFTLRDGKVQG